MAAVNVVIFVHGMVPSPKPEDHHREYNQLWHDLTKHQPELSKVFPEHHQIRVEWGHDPGRPKTTDVMKLRADQRICYAETELANRVSFANVKPGEGEILLPWWRAGVPVVNAATRVATNYVKESIALFGLTDVVYYCSHDGELEVRKAVYETIFSALVPFMGSEDVRLHVISHSLGVTIAFDLMFGLFAPDNSWKKLMPDFLLDETCAPDACKEAYRFWRARAADKRLHLASMSSSASQLPLLVMRKQTLVNALARKELLDASVIGLTGDRVRWKLFYDVDDVLGYPTRPLFNLGEAIEEREVNTSWLAPDAHVRYWQNETVLAETAKLMMETSAVTS